VIYNKTNLNFNKETTTVVMGIFSDEPHPPLLTQLENILGHKLEHLLKQLLISTKYQEITPILSLGKCPTPKICFVGLGPLAEYGLEKYRKAIGKLAKETKEDVTILIETFAVKPHSIHELAAIGSEAIGLATYQFPSYETKAKESKTVEFYLYSDSNIEADIERGIIYADATNQARTLFNEPGNKLTPTELAKRIAQFALDHKLEYQVIEKSDMQQRKMGGILGVNRGSAEPPKIMVVKYQGQPVSEEITALIGKGLTFDTGGYCLKTAVGMKMSKGDMGGAASAFGAFKIAVCLQLPVNLLLVIPSTDNMVSATAIKPGDVLQMMNGKTVEVTNTDAEGRLILGDAITLAKELGASRLIDLATLTGAIVVALGGETTGAFTNNQNFLNNLIQSTTLTNEEIWPMPLFPRDQTSLRSSLVADLDNAPVGKPGAIVAAAFLKEFVGETPWIHLDIAGTADTNEDHELGPKGATGVMVRTIAKYLETLS